MKTSIAAIAFVCLCLSSAAFGQSAVLKGRVIDDKEKPVSSVRIITPDGQADVTDSKGQFTIAFPTIVQPGQATRLELRDKPGWVIYEPLLGNCTTRNAARHFEPLPVIIVPKGSPLALSTKRLSQVIARWADERVQLRSQVKEQQSQLDEYAFLREYAEKYGFTLEQFRAAADEWANSKIAADKLEAGWQEYWKKNYDRAAQLGYESRIALQKKLKRDKEKRLESGRQFISSARLEGDARYIEKKFREAAAAYQAIEAAFQERELVREDFSAEWAATKNSVGNTKLQLGEKVEGQESQLLLGEAVEAFREALSVYTREQLPQEWAGTQNNLGAALSSQGERREGAVGMFLMGDAIKAFREALSVYTREQWPQEWARTQNNLGIALHNQGAHREGAVGMRLLGEAVNAFGEALSAYPREQWPQEWARTQNHLGAALSSQGERSEGAEGERLLGEAVKAFGEALSAYPREQWPQQWAMTQNNLGIALHSKGERSEGAEGVRLLGEAVRTFGEALSAYPREQWPQQWAKTQNNLGVALHSQGKRSEGTDRESLLRKAVNTFLLALEVRDRRYLPFDWALTQKNLADAYFALQDWSHATECYVNLLTIFPRDEQGYQRASGLYHEVLFRFSEAFELKRRWLATSPWDSSTLPDFAENHFTTSRFVECQERIAALLAQPKLAARTRIALRMIGVANLLALDQAAQVPTALKALLDAIAAQPADFRITWSFAGTLHFISQHEKLAAHRAWLNQFFSAAQAENRDAILKALREVQSQFHSSK